LYAVPGPPNTFAGLLFYNFIAIIDLTKPALMQYMIIERFHAGKVKSLYKRFDEKGRMLPEGVNYINSWIDEHVSTCYQLMESDSIESIHQWIGRWSDLADFEVIPVISSTAAKAKALATSDI
jgi:Protein of unknown function (DUF3303)